MRERESGGGGGGYGRVYTNAWRERRESLLTVSILPLQRPLRLWMAPVVAERLLPQAESREIQ